MFSGSGKTIFRNRKIYFPESGAGKSIFRNRKIYFPESGVRSPESGVESQARVQSQSGVRSPEFGVQRGEPSKSPELQVTRASPESGVRSPEFRVESQARVQTPDSGLRTPDSGKLVHPKHSRSFSASSMFRSISSDSISQLSTFRSPECPLRGAVSGEDPFRRPFSTWTRGSGRREGHSGSSESGVRSRTKKGTFRSGESGSISQEDFPESGVNQSSSTTGKVITRRCPCRVTSVSQARRPTLKLRV